MSKRKPFVLPMLTPPLTKDEFDTFVALYRRLMEAAPHVMEAYTRTARIGPWDGRAEWVGPPQDNPYLGGVYLPYGAESHGYFEDSSGTTEQPVDGRFFYDGGAPALLHEEMKEREAESKRLNEEHEHQLGEKAREYERKEYLRLKKKFER